MTAAFSSFGYELTESDLNAIQRRNKTFHGHILGNCDIRNQRDELFATAIRLHKLCGILLFKASGFNGKLLNNEVLFGFEDACINRKEHAYVEL